MKTNIFAIPIALGLMFFAQSSHANFHPINDVSVEANNDKVFIEAEVLLSSPCYETESKTAIVNTFENEIVLGQTAIPMAKTCIQVITPERVYYNLGEVPDGTYEVIDRYDNSLVEKFEIEGDEINFISKKTEKPIE